MIRQVHRCNVDEHEEPTVAMPFLAANADIWSCGVCLFAMLATQLPFGGGEDVRISTQRLVRFRLCPSDTCSMESAYGCKEGYGDYVISMEAYLEAYFEAVEQHPRLKAMLRTGARLTELDDSELRSLLYITRTS